MHLRTKLLAGVTMTAAERATGRYMRAPDEHPAPPPPPADTPPADLPMAGAPAAAEPDAFEAAFAAEIAPPPEPPAAAPEPPATPPPATPPPATPPAATPPAAEPPAEPPVTPPAAAPAAPAAPAAATADDIVARLAQVIGERPAPPPAAPAPAPEQPAFYSPDETSLLGEYESNWPDVSRAETLKRRGEYNDLMKFVFTEVNKHTAPLFEQLRGIGNTLHTGELKTLVPDYTPDLEASVASWIETQPTYLQAPYKQVMQTGTSDEVADLFGRYKAQTGVAPAPQAAAPAPAAAAPPAPAKVPTAPKTELSSAAKQAAESLAPVSGERSQVPQGEDLQDYQSAFAKYAASTG